MTVGVRDMKGPFLTAMTSGHLISLTSTPRLTEATCVRNTWICGVARFEPSWWYKILDFVLYGLPFLINSVLNTLHFIIFNIVIGFFYSIYAFPFVFILLLLTLKILIVDCIVSAVVLLWDLLLH